MVEVFYQLVKLLPPEGVRLTRFEMKPDALLIEGQASTINNALQLREDLVKPGGPFSAWDFDAGFGQPTAMPDGQATFKAEGHRKDFIANTAP